MATLKNRLRKTLFANIDQKNIDRFYQIYYRLRYPDAMSRKCSFGDNNADKIFYLIRPRTDGIEGLMSLFMNVSKNIHFAIEHGYEPVVDFKNYHTQYDDNIAGETNSWNFFFTEPTDYSLSEVYTSKNVILSGLESQWYRPEMFDRNFNNISLQRIHEFIFSYIDFSCEVKKATELQMKQLGFSAETTMGLYLRGTDYTSLKPSGHPVQPTVAQAIAMVDEYLETENINKIFLVTEDGLIYDSIKKRYGNLCMTTSEDTFIRNYDGKNFLSHDKSIDTLGASPYHRGLDYLVKLIILSNCEYLIGGNTMGSWASCVFSTTPFRNKYIFDLGLYGK